MLQEKKVCRQPFFLATEGSVSHRAESLVWCRPATAPVFAAVPGWTWLRRPGSTEAAGGCGFLLTVTGFGLVEKAPVLSEVTCSSSCEV